jgi:hypothetical protein
MSDPWWYAGCLANIQTLGGTMCPQNHCDTTIVKNYSEQYCNCSGAYPNGCSGSSPPPNCCSYSAVSPVPIISEGCYCCCGCFSNETPIAYDKGVYKAIVEYQVGDLVYVADDVTLTSWSQKPVLFSAGAGGGAAAENVMLMVTFGDAPNTDYLLVNRTQPFLTTVGLVPAAALVPGTHELRTADGGTKMVQSLEVGMFKKGMHHIATSTQPATSPDGHLIVAKGVVCGDWALQMAARATAPTDAASAPPSEAATASSSASFAHTTQLAFVEDAHLLPEFGTREYAEAHPHLQHEPFRASHPQLDLSAVAAARPPLEHFEAFDVDDTAFVPADAWSFFTADQAWDIAANAPSFSPASGAGRPVVEYQFKLFRTFYPDIEFYFDERKLTPNAYLFTEYGKLRLIVTGGLARVQCLQFEGLATIIATMIAATTAGDPKNAQGMSCLGTASYGVPGVLTEVWIGLQSAPIMSKGITQITTLFSYITDGNKGGSDTCMHVSCDCRIQAMQASFTMLPLPSCAGGPPDPQLEVSAASGQTGDPHGSVSVSFSLPLDPVSATELGNYLFDPLVQAFSVEIAEGDPSAVVIGADLAAQTKYTVTVYGVESSEQQPLVPGKNSAEFTTA